MTILLLAEFDSPNGCARAVRNLREHGSWKLNAYMPYPAREVEEALELPASPLPKWVLLFGLLGAATAYLILYFTQNVSYPLDVGGRPTHAVPAYVPITFETTVLFACGAAFFGLLTLCRLPRLWHPVFEVEGFSRASVDRFFLAIDVGEGTSRETTVQDRLLGLGALRVTRVDTLGEGP